MAVSYDRLNNCTRDKFGQLINYTPAGGVAREVSAIINQTYVSEVGGIGRQTKSVFIQVVDADVPELAAGDVFEFSGVSYEAKEIRPDFAGMTDILLNEV